MPLEQQPSPQPPPPPQQQRHHPFSPPPPPPPHRSRFLTTNHDNDNAADKKDDDVSSSLCQLKFNEDHWHAEGVQLLYHNPNRPQQSSELRSVYDTQVHLYNVYTAIPKGNPSFLNRFCTSSSSSSSSSNGSNDDVFVTDIECDLQRYRFDKPVMDSAVSNYDYFCNHTILEEKKKKIEEEEKKIILLLLVLPI